MSTPQTHLLALLPALIRLHGLQARQVEITDVFRVLSAKSLAHFPEPHARRLSTFSSDGIPFELSLSLGRSAGGGLRYGTEAGDLRAPMTERLIQGHETILQILSRIGASRWLELHNCLFEDIFPPQIRALNDYRFGMWQGVVHRLNYPDTLKVYYNALPQQGSLDLLLEKLQKTLDPVLEVSKLRDLANGLPKDSQTVFLGIDYSADGHLRAKIYHRCVAATARSSINHLLAAMGLSDHGPVAEIFLQDLFGLQDRLPPRSLVIHMGLDSRMQEPVLGLYVALNRFFDSDELAHQHISKLLMSLGLGSLWYKQSLHILAGDDLPVNGMHHHTLLGLGLSLVAFKVNVYMRPALLNPNA